MDRVSHAVVMGDLVRSEAIAAQDRLHGIFNTAIDARNAADAATLASPLTITLGDEFQGLATRLAGAAAVARALRIALMAQGVECRFAIGAVSLATPVNPTRAWNMMGPGLAETRDRLNEKRDETLYRFVLPGEPVIERLVETIGAALTAIERRWTQRQRGDVAALLSGADVAEIADARGVSVHSVYKVRAAADYDRYVAHWAAIGDALAMLDARWGLA